MSIVKSEFALALNQVATERGISADDVLSSIEAAILAAYRKEMHEEGVEVAEEAPIKVKLDRDTGEAHLLEEGKDITPPGFGRIAAQTAKQVTLQKIREVEKKTVISHYSSQMGTMVRGRVIRYDGYNAYVDIGRVEAVLPKEEQIKNEKYEVNVTQVFFLKEISEDKFGNSRIVVSRTDPRLITELFKKEVPEIANGTVEIKIVVREPGDRAKIAVASSQGGVDPVGACVGQKGVRVQTVTNELGGDEKLDIIQWNKDEALFLTSALSPAKITKVELDQKAKKAKVSVEEKEAPLAIGRGGINVNLASKLTGYEIDIIQIPTPAEEKVEEPKKEQKADDQKAKEKTLDKSPAPSQTAQEPAEAAAEAGPASTEAPSGEAAPVAETADNQPQTAQPEPAVEPASQEAPAQAPKPEETETQKIEPEQAQPAEEKKAEEEASNEPAPETKTDAPAENKLP